MDDATRVAERPVRYAYRLAVVFAVIGLLGVFVSPVVGAASALLYGSVAWGLRNKSFWAAVMGACFVAVSVIAVLVNVVVHPVGASPGPAALGLNLLIAAMPLCFFLLAARSLWEQRRAPSGWLAGIVFIVMFWTCLRPFSMPTGSMENTLLVGDQILVETVSGRLGRAPARGDIVAFHYPVNPQDAFIKRIVGIPGDRLRLVNKQLFVNGVRAIEPYATHKTEYIDSYRDNFPSEPNVPLYPQGAQMLSENVKNGEVIVPANKYFVLGDNRDSSLDSRYWGFVSPAEIIGRPVLIYGSNETGGDPSQPKSPSILTTRWRRLLRIV